MSVDPKIVQNLDQSALSVKHDLSDAEAAGKAINERANSLYSHCRRLHSRPVLWRGRRRAIVNIFLDLTRVLSQQQSLVELMMQVKTCASGGLAGCGLPRAELNPVVQSGWMNHSWFECVIF